jgi:hypothetical protein
MLFGAQSFSSAPFSSEFVGNVTILATGERINISIGSIEVDIVIRVIGNQINLATNTVDVINWNSIIPGATGVWIPIDPDNP